MIYDGPGTKAERLSGYIIKGTTFQLTIQVCGNILHSANDFASNRSNFNYKSKNLIQSKNFSINTDEILTVKSSMHHDRLIPVVMYGFHASKNHHVNLTITDYFYEGLDSAGCSYGGLAAFEIIKGINHEILSLCNKKTNLLTKHRNIYSAEEKLLVVVYSYRNYSRIRVQLKISSTVCEVIRVDICKLQQLTGSKLANYVHKITQFSTLNFLVKNHEIGLIPDVVFDLNQSYASILHNLQNNLNIFAKHLLDLLSYLKVMTWITA